MLIAACSSKLLRYSDGGEEGFLGRRGVSGLVLEQNLAADAVQERVAPVLTCVARARQPRVDRVQCFFGVFSFDF